MADVAVATTMATKLANIEMGISLVPELSDILAFTDRLVTRPGR